MLAMIARTILIIIIMGGKRILHIRAIAKREGYLWVPLVTVEGHWVYRGAPVVRYSQALRKARDAAAVVRVLRRGEESWQPSTS